ncbi:hypothetical protein GCM10022226_40730 [Sphaerisporangium flaviroseum]|uniref:Bacterial transcriptional activator domain-containing protein n=1 Tax=Sphaerisporangium flaviroseum TaxID=509199 RepID=A0ABP7IDP4_9ACTN
MTVVSDECTSGVLIRLAGTFAVERDGVPCPRALIGGRARTLLQLLTVERCHAVPAAHIVDVLWDGNPPKRPADNIATLVSRLRRTLGPAAVTGGRRGYRLGEVPAVTVDLDEAAALVAEAEHRLAVDAASLANGSTAPAEHEGAPAGKEAALAGVAAARALALLGCGTVLGEEADAQWVTSAQGEAEDLLRRARHAAAAAGLRTGRPADGRRTVEAAVAADPFDEAAYRLLMRAHAASGEPARALLVYKRLRDTLAAELGTDPAVETRDLHLAILRATGRPLATGDRPPR